MNEREGAAVLGLRDAAQSRPGSSAASGVAVPVR